MQPGYMSGFDPNGQPRIGLDNLEYHLMTRDYGRTGAQYVNTSQGTNSAPMTATMTTSPSTSSSGVILIQNEGSVASAACSSLPPPSTSLPQHHHHHPTVPQMGTQVIHILGGRKLSSNDPSDEGSDDHDYYNDYDDRLQRELQPLHHRRNETTV